MMEKKHTGQCACGNVQFGFDGDPDFIADCYCKDCQKAGGGAMATFFAIPADDFTVTSGKPRAFHYTANSGNGLDRNFCPECGARLFTSNLEGFPGMVFVTIGSLDNAAGIAPKLEMFTSRRLPWLHALDLPQFPQMPS
ncbi:GFA family protein [Dyella telluris]|nr:GFA family protein [Dyella telluris]